MTQDSETAFCVDCLFLLGKRSSPEHALSWRCNHADNLASKVRNPVTGAYIFKYKVHEIFDQRSNHCRGNLFVPYHSQSLPQSQTQPIAVKEKLSVKNIGITDL